MNEKRIRLLREKFEDSPVYMSLKGEERLRNSIEYKSLWRQWERDYNRERKEGNDI